MLYEKLVSKTNYQWDKYDMVLDYLKDTLEDYNKSIQLLEGYVKCRVLENKDIVLCLSPKIIETVAYYLEGRVYFAHNSMKEVFESVKEILVRKSASRYSTNLEFGFKVRVSKQGEPFPVTRAEMFHIPFEKRHLVQDNRYSIHGLPSIYLGRSIYDCYCELGKPPIENMWVSLFCFSQNRNNLLDSQHIRLVDLTYLNAHRIDLELKLAQNDKEKYILLLNKLVDDILLWPLIMSCSIACRYSNASFKQEYIIPQILYQLCSEKNEFTGVKYYSTKLTNGDKGKLQDVMINYALPAQDVKRSGLCPSLARQLILTEPVNISNCRDIEVVSEYGNTKNGFPVIKEDHRNDKADKLIVEMNQMTMYFENLMTSFVKDKKIELLGPVNGWNDKED